MTGTDAAGRTIPVLPSRDFSTTSGFYAALGFATTSEFPGEYLIVRRDDGLELHFFAAPHLEPATNDHGCYIRLRSAAAVDDTHDAWRDAIPDSGELTTPIDTDYGLREFAVLDPDRNQVRVGGVL